MKYARIFFTLSSALIVAASVFGMSAEARKSDLDQCTASGLGKAECACVMALEKGTQKALRDFLKLYRNADTSCNAQVSTANLTEDNNDGGESGSSSSSNGGSSSSNASSSKNNKGHGNGNEGDCHGGGCSDSDNPGNSNGSSGNSKGNNH